MNDMPFMNWASSGTALQADEVNSIARLVNRSTDSIGRWARCTSRVTPVEVAFFPWHTLQTATSDLPRHAAEWLAS